MLRTVDELNISNKHKSQLRRAAERKNNQFLEQWIVPSLEGDVAAFPHLFRRETGSFLHFDMDEMADEYAAPNGEIDWQAVFQATVLFTNPLRIGEYDKTKRIPGQHSGGTPPSERIQNGGWVVLTYEVDEDTVECLEMQLDWFAGKPEVCPFSKAHSALSQYADYRGYCAVFSGNKSVHIHCLFDIRHLTKSMLPRGKASYRKLWSFDLADHLFAPLYRQVWAEVATELQQALSTDATFDPRLSSYVQKRRSPWGIRTLARGAALHGFAPDDRIEQIVIQERLAKKILAPLGAPSVFCASKAKHMEKAVRDIDNLPSVRAVTSQHSAHLLEELQNYLVANGFPPYPKPVDMCFEGEYNMVFFQNDAADVHPSTFVRGDYRRLACAGKGAPTETMFLPNELTLDQTLDLLPSAHQLVNTGYVAADWRQRVGQPLANAVDAQSARALAAPIFEAMATRNRPTLIQGPEGLGKTRALMLALPELAWEDDLAFLGTSDASAKLVSSVRGFTAFASGSYEQLSDKAREFDSLHGGDVKAVMLPSMSGLYEMAAANVGQRNMATREAAGAAGAPSFLHHIQRHQPKVFAEMERLRDDIWRTQNGDVVFNPNAFVFLVHGLLKVWPHATFSRGFLHPDCPSDLDPTRVAECAKQMRFRRVIYDEVSWDDLVAVVPAWKRKLAAKIKKTCKKASSSPWDEARLSDRVRAYNAETGGGSVDVSDFSFDECDQIIRLKLRPSDLVKVDADRFPFGKGGNDHNFYRSSHGRKYYCKPWRWYWSLGCPVVILTTEDLPRLIVKGINQSKTNADAKRFGVVNMTHAPHLFRDAVPLVFDERARAQRTDRADVVDLADDLLADGFDYVISNSLKPTDPRWQGRVMSHSGARGQNGMEGSKIASVLTYPALTLYEQLCVLGAAFGIEDPVKVAFRDQVHQSLGRNLGFRRTPNKNQDEHVVVMKPSLFRDLDQLSGHSVPKVGSDRYKFFVADWASL